MKVVNLLKVDNLWLNLDKSKDFSKGRRVASQKQIKMKTIKSADLLDQLSADTRTILATVIRLRAEDPATLLASPAPGAWSVAQILEHLNSYGRYYLPALERALQQKSASTEWYTPGWLGNYFTNLISPTTEGQVKSKMKSPKEHAPAPHIDINPVVETFIAQQHILLGLLEKAKSKNIGTIRVPISISKMIRLKAGDTFRFLVGHEQRHFLQIERTLQTLKSTPIRFAHA